MIELKYVLELSTVCPLPNPLPQAGEGAYRGGLIVASSQPKRERASNEPDEFKTSSGRINNATLPLFEDVGELIGGVDMKPGAAFSPLSRLRERARERATMVELKYVLELSTVFPLPNPLPQAGEGAYRGGLNCG